MGAPAILVHGGAGRILDTDRAESCAEGCLSAAREGYRVLRAGGSALDAVEAASVVLEDDPRFNAGTGAALNADGVIEHDAMVMDGQSLDVGGVAILQGFANPIRIARAVMERSPHAIVAAEGAARWARDHGFEPAPPGALIVEGVLERWKRERDAGWPRRPGTIGAVAVDAEGHVAAANSTGGISGKLAGRIGDSPIPGGGTYADDRSGAAAATGYGEDIMRIVMAKLACDRMAAGATAQEAADAAVAELARVNGEAGIIVVDRKGRLGAAFNTARMSRAWVDGDGVEGSGFE